MKIFCKIDYRVKSVPTFNMSFMNKNKIKYRFSIVTVCIVSLILSGCSFSITRTEQDKYTLTELDTNISTEVKNIPGVVRDNGTIYPSTRVVNSTRRYLQTDTVVERKYPNFLRFGIIETVGLVAPATSDKGTGNGLFGLFKSLSAKHPDEPKIMGANIFRFIPFESQFKLLNDSPDWVIGTSLTEFITFQKDSSVGLERGEYLIGFLHSYLKRRFYLRDKIPYIFWTPYLGVSIFPSQYFNAGVSLDVGSYGGFNIRGYAGYVAGTTWELGETKTKNPNLSFPYFGLGVSALDFINKPEELEKEWEHYKHSAVEVSAINIDLIHAFSSETRSFFNTVFQDTLGETFTGGILKIASANFPVSISGNDKFFLGTSLFNLHALSKNAIGFGFLPLRGGYRESFFKEALNLEAFFEQTYYPSSISHLGLRATLTISDWTQFNIVAGYSYVSAYEDPIAGLETLKTTESIGTAYLGLGIGIGDVINSLEKILKDREF